MWQLGFQLDPMLNQPNLMQERSRVNFINVLQAAFARSDPKDAKKTVKLTVSIALSGSAGKKAAHRMLMKLTPADNGKPRKIMLT